MFGNSLKQLMTFFLVWSLSIQATDFQTEYGLSPTGHLVLLPQEAEVADLPSPALLRALEVHLPSDQFLQMESFYHGMFQAPEISDRQQAMREFRQRLLTLRGSNPSLFREIETQVREQEGQEPGLPAYCSHLPSIDQEAINSFFPSSDELGQIAYCFDGTGYSVNQGLLTLAENVRTIGQRSLSMRPQDFRARMMSLVTRNLLEQRARYGDLPQNPEELFPSCFTSQREEAIARDPGGELQALSSVPLPNPPAYNTGLFRSNFRQNFNEARSMKAPEGGEAGLTPQSPHEIFLQNTIERSLFTAAIDFYQIRLSDNYTGICRLNADINHIVENNILETNVGSLDSIYSPPQQEFIVNCLRNLQTEDSLSYTHEGAGTTFLIDAESVFNPLLFERNSHGLPSSEPSQSIHRSAFENSSYRELMGEVLPLLRGGIVDFQERFQEFVTENKQRIEQVTSELQQSESFSNSFNQEVEEFRDELDRSINRICENEGQDLHHITELVAETRQQILEENSNLSEEAREELLIETQMIECNFLRERPNQGAAGIHPAIGVLGGVAGTVLGATMPLVGLGIMLGMTAVDRGERLRNQEQRYMNMSALQAAGLVELDQARAELPQYGAELGGFLSELMLGSIHFRSMGARIIHDQATAFAGLGVTIGLSGTPQEGSDGEQLGGSLRQEARVETLGLEGEPPVEK